MRKKDIETATRMVAEEVKRMLELKTDGLKDAIHDLIDAIEEQNESYKLRDFNMKEERIPLTNKSYEQTLLGGLMLDNNGFDEVLSTRLCQCHFKEHRDRVIFRAMRNLYCQKKPMDTLSVFEELQKLNMADASTEKYLFDLAKEVSSKAIPHLKSIANVVMLNSHDRERGKK